MFVDPARPGPARSAACQARLIIPPMPPVRRALPEPDTRCDQRAAAPPPRVSGRAARPVAAQPAKWSAKKDP